MELSVVLWVSCLGLSPSCYLSGHRFHLGPPISGVPLVALRFPARPLGLKPLERSTNTSSSGSMLLRYAPNQEHGEARLFRHHATDGLPAPSSSFLRLRDFVGFGWSGAGVGVTLRGARGLRSLVVGEAVSDAS